jgi:hypothetical protein
MPTEKLKHTKDAAEEVGLQPPTLRYLYRQRKVSGMPLGHRTLMFKVSQLREELKRLEIKAVV